MHVIWVCIFTNSYRSTDHRHKLWHTLSRACISSVKRKKCGNIRSQLITANKALIDVQLYVHRRAEALSRVPEKVLFALSVTCFHAHRTIYTCMRRAAFHAFSRIPSIFWDLFYAAYINDKLLAKWNTRCAIVLHESVYICKISLQLTKI